MIIMTAEGVFPKVAGDMIYTSEYNNFNLTRNKIVELYTGDGFNTSQSGAGTNTVYYETATISGLTYFKYLIIEITQQSYAYSNNSGGDYGLTTLAIATKEVGGAYADSMSAKTIHSCKNEYSGSTAARSSYNTSTIKWVHTLTAGEISNGCVVKITSTSVAAGSSSSSLTNVQTVFELKGE